jgi:hypothetical protein
MLLDVAILDHRVQPREQNVIVHRIENPIKMNDYVRTLCQHSLLNCHPHSLSRIALNAVYEQWVVTPLQRAWKRKDHQALRSKYVCVNCLDVIKHDTNKSICRICRYRHKFITEEAARLDYFLY